MHTWAHNGGPNSLVCLACGVEAERVVKLSGEWVEYRFPNEGWSRKLLVCPEHRRSTI